MARFDDIGSVSLTNFGQLVGDMVINTFDNLVRGVLFELMSANVNNFNLMNYDFMNIHMFRNSYEKEITLTTLGENAYRDGNSDATATPALYPTYTMGNNYMEFVTNTREGEKNGVLVTRVQKAGESNTNKYLDMDTGENQVDFTGSFLDRNSILYKTKRLMRQHKLKTIISEYHTKGVEYNGQVGSEYGESHGRNLLTKSSENGSPEYDEYGYDNPYCRVWTHHNKYDRFEKSMRADTRGMNTWENFEWNETDKGHEKDNSNYGDGENYDYAWRGKHNQDRREMHSALDTTTGLVKVTPQYRGGGETNRHTKDCMFSIENLAWKDYDPYSFEQALSWEQRGPLGGRIMWFPPYGIEVNETATAKWHSNDFIGRGEPVYTYVNSERTGNLSFIMITDHPSSVDYASWWDDNNIVTGVDDNQGNTENDYLRYFAGCYDNDTDGKTGGLIIKPTPMTDEYTRENPPLIEGLKQMKVVQKKQSEPPTPPIEDKNPEYVEFFVFFPNNYSGVNDQPLNTNSSSVDAIIYLLAGKNANKSNGVDDIPLTFSDFESYTDYRDDFIGYEMVKSGITAKNCIEGTEYIQGGTLIPKSEPKYDYKVDKNKKWCYRIDHKQPYVGGKRDGTNLICEKLTVATNYKDTVTYKTNFDVTNNTRVQEMAQHKESLYSFAEVAAAINSKKIQGVEKNPNIDGFQQYLTDCGIKSERVNKLIELFGNKDQYITSVVCDGIASSHGHTEENELLSKNRANTVLRWIRSESCLNKKSDITYTIGTYQTKDVDDVDKSNVNGESVKLYRCAHCVMTFESGVTQAVQPENNNIGQTSEEPTDNTPEHIEYLGFKWVKDEPRPDGSVWNYYKKDGEIKYFDQIGGSIDNYENVETDDVVVDKDQILQIFRELLPNVYSWELSSLITKSAAVLCLTVDAMIKEVTGESGQTFDGNEGYSCIWKYGTTNDLVTPDNITTAIDLWAYAQSLEPDSRSSSAAQSPKIKFSADEDKFLATLISKNEVSTQIEQLRSYIILYRILDGINKVNDTQGTRNVCENAAENDEEMQEKTKHLDESITDREDCKDSLWIDRGDRLLIQECNLPEDGESDLILSRFNPETGEGEWNKLRYDQEYHFYKQYMIDHPFEFEKLQEKIKYFNPAFHSMTPEGFNVRCTFLQQCTRQGNTKTMSDKGGRTANNLAFGRAPYCVLRLGDFYNQMIVIDSVSFDYNISDGLQWDLNTEGNGVQPMLCKVNISFKFIGGGDITGPVQRLQNAMSFNYYANTSFYDNRADRVEYQPANWKTMGGAGNNEIDTDKSYAYIAQNYGKLEERITRPGF